ncbi:hypothetical protein W97_05069 [Coniosporium apollinis CBS 100218]|uniref:Uncharacterized protein n=1 Tax=Coniosporium apollinis (strain CBS 100218) TaxID=1168221 RepID=R7YV93_CONA1|nr:uncharacterized protein W97_05069 [Coniosporium apollinis CBS 100218]EON65827.1 hypothetical protein W97_05069 [Coniosporium apollinis CBS 100218]
MTTDNSSFSKTGPKSESKTTLKTRSDQKSKTRSKIERKMESKPISSPNESPAKRRRVGGSSPSTNTQSARDTSDSIETEPERKDIFSTLTEELHRMILDNIAKDEKFDPKQLGWLERRPEDFNLTLTKFDDADWESIMALLATSKATRHAMLQHLLDNEIMRIFVQLSDDRRSLHVDDIGHPALTLGAFSSPDAPKFAPRYLVIIFELNPDHEVQHPASALSEALRPLLPDVLTRLRNLTIVQRRARRRTINKYGWSRIFSTEFFHDQDNLGSQLRRLWCRFVKEQPVHVHSSFRVCGVQSEWVAERIRGTVAVGDGIAAATELNTSEDESDTSQEE